MAYVFDVSCTSLRCLEKSNCMKIKYGIIITIRCHKPGKYYNSLADLQIALPSCFCVTIVGLVAQNMPAGSTDGHWPLRSFRRVYPDIACRRYR